MPQANARCLRLLVAALVFSSLAACGGGGGGGVPGRFPGDDPNKDDPPTAQVLAPLGGVLSMAGDSFGLSFLAEDDGAAVVTVLADADLDPGTTDDQTPLFVGASSNGVQQDVSVRTRASLAPGAYALILRVDDGVNAAVEVPVPDRLVVYPGIAGVAPPRSNRYGVVGDVVVFSRGEAEDAAGVLNADGDTTDGVMVALDATTGLMSQPNPSISFDLTPVAQGTVRPLPNTGGVLSWLTREVDEGRNLNAGNNQRAVPPLGGPDVDQVDTMLSYVAPQRSLTPITNTWGGASAILGGEGGFVVVRYVEAGEGSGPGGGSDLNFDTDAFDAVFGAVDANALALGNEYDQIVFFNSPPAVASGTVFRSAGTSMAAMLTTEVGAAAATDFNADGDGGDTFLWLGDLLQGAVPGGTPANFLALAGTQQVPAAAPPSPVDPTAAFDVTGDGHAGYYLDEGAHNVPPGLAAGNDRNGDAVIGFVPAIYHVATMTETIPAGAAGPLNSLPGAATMVYDDTRAFFTATEAPRLDPAPGGNVLGTNGDGDNGADLSILYWTDHTQPLPVAAPVAVNFGGGITLNALSLDGPGSVTALAPGWLAVVVSEQANGGQDINGSGRLDLAYLLIDTTAQPAPVVHNPKLVPSTAGTIPLGGIPADDDAGTRGVVLRVTEAANGDLDKDGNGNETFLAYISYTSPDFFVLLDAGGDHCTVANGLIAVTANESFTGRDYDGNDVIGGTVFRVLDLAGRVIEGGRPCSALSVPLTGSGVTWAYLRDENAEGRDLNRDADMTDLVLGLWRR